MEKYCRKCEKTKDVSMFYADASNKRDGLSSHCKECRNAMHARYVSANRENLGKYRLAWYAKNKAEVRRKANYAYKTCSARRVSLKKYYEKHKDKILKRDAVYIKEKTAVMRKQVIDFYGGACACCGEREFRFLTMDHIGGGGAEHRRRFGGSYMRWRDMLHDPKGRERYRVLCMNCNWAIRFGEPCPHQRGKMTV